MKENRKVADILFTMGKLKKNQSEENFHKYIDFLDSLNKEERDALIEHLDTMIDYLSTDGGV